MLAILLMFIIIFENRQQVVIMKILTVDQIINLMKLKNIKELGSVSFSL